MVVSTEIDFLTMYSHDRLHAHMSTICAYLVSVGVIALDIKKKLVARSLVGAEELLRLGHRMRHQLLSWSPC